MKKYFLLLTLLALSLSSVSANNYSWTGAYLKLNAGYSNLKLNYSGDQPCEVQISKIKEPSFRNPYSRGYRNYTIAEKVSAHGAILESALGISQEISESFGLLGEFGGTFGGASQFLNSTDALIKQTYFAVGLFYHQPSFRILGMGALGVGKDIFGYTNVIDSLEKGETVSVSKNENLLNSSYGITYRGAIGFDYKITPNILLGVSYTYTRSQTNVELENEETFYISNHSFAAMIGLHI